MIANLALMPLAMQIGAVQITDETWRARIDTQVPRSAAKAYWISYTATDSAGNQGTGLRQVVVTCPGKETICWEDDAMRQSACSLNGRCVDESLSALGTQNVDGVNALWRLGTDLHRSVTVNGC